MSKKDSRLARAGVSGFNKPKRTPNHPKKSHIVVAKEGDKIKREGKGGRPGQWSARKAQMLAKQYKAKGGGYK